MRNTLLGVAASALLWAPALAQNAGNDQQASPSKLPASQARTGAVTQQGQAPNAGSVGTQQASPSERPASQATTDVVRHRDEKPSQ
jgi:hypothetical protein